MGSFFDIQESLDSPREVSIDSYLDTLHGFKQLRVMTMMVVMLKMMVAIHAGYKVPDGVPEIRIQPGSDGSPAALANLIVVPEGFIDHCLGAAFAPIDRVVTSDFDLMWWSDELISVYGFAWAIAHEYFHLARMHWIFDANDGTRTQDVSLATERDADLCAIAMIYRYMQKHLSHFADDTTLRQAALYSVFWIVRSLPNASKAGTHLPISNRLRDMSIKLAMLREDPSEPPDPGAQLPATKERALYLRDCLVRCEQGYLELFPESESMWRELQIAYEDSPLRRAVLEWDKIGH